MKFASSFLAVALTVGRLVAAAPAIDVVKDGAINAIFCGDTCSTFLVNPGVCTATNLENIENAAITPPEAACQLFVDPQCQGDNITVKGSGSIPSEYSSISSITCTSTA